MQYPQSPPELLNLGAKTEGNRQKENFYAKWQIESVWQGLVQYYISNILQRFATSSLECKKQKYYCLPKMQPQQWAKFDTPLTLSALRTDVVPLTERKLQRLLATR